MRGRQPGQPPPAAGTGYANVTGHRTRRCCKDSALLSTTQCERCHGRAPCTVLQRVLFAVIPVNSQRLRWAVSPLQGFAAGVNGCGGRQAGDATTGKRIRACRPGLRGKRNPDRCCCHQESKTPDRGLPQIHPGRSAFQSQATRYFLPLYEKIILLDEILCGRRLCVKSFAPGSRPGGPCPAFGKIVMYNVDDVPYSWITSWRKSRNLGAAGRVVMSWHRSMSAFLWPD